MAGPQDKSQPTAIVNLPGGIPGDVPNGLSNLDPNQLMTLLRTLNVPGVFNKLQEHGSLNKEDAAQTLSNLSQSGYQLPPGLPGGAGTTGAVEPGPSSHPRGPPNLGQPGVSPTLPVPSRKADEETDGDNSAGGSANEGPASSGTTPSNRRAANRSMPNDEWTRIRKDNHKEVERRRRGNINEGINELGRIVPNGSGEKAKGAILSRAVQYIHHLKENEARNIEKWTLEKLLMDQAMGDLQAQLEEVRRLWEEERTARQRAETELEQLKGGRPTGADDAKRKAENEGERDGKRQRSD